MARVMSFATPMPRDDADDAAEQRHGGRFDEELQQDVVAARAERLADADFAGALGDGDEHDVHDDDAADDQRDGGDGCDDGAEAVEDVAKQILEGGAGVDGERILGTRRQVAADAHDGAQLVHDVRPSLRRRRRHRRRSSMVSCAP